MLIVSILVGHFGIDRMLIGDTGLGVIKTSHLRRPWFLDTHRLVLHHKSHQRKEHRENQAVFILAPMNRPRLYALLSAACIAGYSWLAVASYIQVARSWNPVELSV